MLFHDQEGSLVDHRAYKLYTLVGPPALQLVLDPLDVIFLNNCLYILMIFYMLNFTLKILVQKCYRSILNIQSKFWTMQLTLN